MSRVRTFDLNITGYIGSTTMSGAGLGTGSGLHSGPVMRSSVSPDLRASHNPRGALLPAVHPFPAGPCSCGARDCGVCTPCTLLQHVPASADDAGKTLGPQGHGPANESAQVTLSQDRADFDVRIGQCLQPMQPGRSFMRKHEPRFWVPEQLPDDGLHSRDQDKFTSNHYVPSVLPSL